MKRWMVAKLGDYEGDGSIVPATNKYESNTRIWSKPGFDWCVGQIAAADLTAINADPDIFILPDATLDTLFSTLSTATKTAVRNKLAAAGFDTTGVLGTRTIRQILVYLVKQIQPGIDSVEQGDVPDLTT